MRPMRLLLAVVFLFLLTGATGAAGTKWKEVRKPRTPPSEALTRGDLDCSGAIPIVVGQTIWSDNTGGPTNVDSYPVCISWDESGGEAVFELTLEGPACQDIGISLWCGDYYGDCDLDWFLLGSCDEADCIAYDDYSWPVYCLDPGTYYIVVDGYQGDECEFALSVYHNEPVPECGPLASICHMWDFNVSAEGFTHDDCGSPGLVWEWGPAPAGIPQTACGETPVTNVLCTGLSGSYPNDAGDAAFVGPVLVSEDCSCLELCHFYDIEQEFDGGMVGVTTDGGTTWSLITPAGGYDLIGDWDNSCIGPWPCFSGEGASQFMVDYFDLSPWIGSAVSIGFFFGSDDSFNAEGWYILWAALGASQSPVENSSWGAIKGLYR